MATVINTCQKVCAELTSPPGTGPYIWFSVNSNVLVAVSGTGLNAVISGNLAGPAEVQVFDFFDTPIAVFNFTVVNYYDYIPSVTSNTAYLASTTQSASATSLGTLGTFSGPFGSFSTTGNANNTVWFSMVAASGASFNGVTNVYWDRSTNANQVLVDHDTITTVTLSILGLGVRSITPAFNALDFQVPIVQYATGSQISSFSSEITLPYDLSCGDLTNYGIFAQNTTTSPSTNRIVACTLSSGNLLKIGWNVAVTSYAISYMIVGLGVVSTSSLVLNYSDSVSAMISSPTGFVDITITQAFTVGQLIWFAMLDPGTISNDSAYNFRIVAAYQTTTTNLRLEYNSITSGSSTPTIYIMGFTNLNTGGISLAEN